jgi:hypothetical protein
MSTTKNKSNPAGRFDVRLAPTLNWVARLTPGSWCTILMSRSVFPEVSRNDPGIADQRLVRMLGRIDSVRLSVTVDQESGARKTEYVVTGQDWGQIFNSKLYIDPIARNNNFDGLSAVGHAERIVFDKLTTDMLDKKAKLPSSATIFNALIKVWGSPLSDQLPSVTSLFSDSNNPTPALVTQAQYKIPSEVVQYFGFGGGNNRSFIGPINVMSSQNFGDLLEVIHGKLDSLDTYSGDKGDAFGFINPTSLYGINTFWQILMDNSNPTINEMVTDMRWEDGVPKLAVYRRVRPFLIRDTFEGSTESEVEKNLSLFKNVRRARIPVKDVITINAGTNLNEKINFIEIKPESMIQESHEARVKLESQVFDYNAYERDGFRPLIEKCWYIPFASDDPSPIDAVQWKHLLREWHFPKDNMLNGAISFIGLDDYIQVGDNIMVEASVFGAPFNKAQADQVNGGGSDVPYFLAHVEQVENNFEADSASGARTFITTVRFVRGVITDSNGQTLGVSGGSFFGPSLPLFGGIGLGGGDKGGAIDREASEMTKDDERHVNVNKRSLKSDPLTNDLKNNDDDGLPNI